MMSSLETDPFDVEILPAEVAEMIISRLPIQDRLNACLVSKDWNKTIGNSSVFKRTTKITIHSWDTNQRLREFYQHINQSKRGYDEIEIHNKTLNMWFYIALSGSCKVGIKNVTIDGVTDPMQLYEALKTFRYVKNLRLINIKTLNIELNHLGVHVHHSDMASQSEARNARHSENNSILEDSDKIKIDFHLENMESLVISCMDASSFQVINRKHPKLKSLSLRYLDSKVGSLAIPQIFGFLCHNQYTIENLELNGQIFKQIFEHDANDLMQNITLKCLSIELNPSISSTLSINQRPFRNPDYHRDLMIARERMQIRAQRNAFLNNEQEQGENQEDQEPPVQRRRQNDYDDAPVELQRIKQNMIKFLAAQGKTLESLKVILNKHDCRLGRTFHRHASPDLRDSDIEDREAVKLSCLDFMFKAWPSLIMLKSLTIRFLKNVQVDTDHILTLKKISNISFVGFQFINVTISTETIVGFLSACPNVREVYVTILNDKILDFCVKNLERLSSIKCSKLKVNATELQQAFEILKTANHLMDIEDNHFYG